MTFYSLLSRYYEEIFPCDPDLVEFLLARMDQKGALLDAGCGTGELVRQLHQRGAEAFGFDLDRQMVRQAEGKSSDSGRFRQDDLVAFGNAYDANAFGVVNCVGNTIVHINREGILEFLKQVNKVLAPRGTLVLQTLNYTNLEAEGLLFPDRKTEHCLFQRAYTKGADPELYYFDTKLTDLATGEIFPNRVEHYPLTHQVLTGMLENRGFCKVEIMEDWKGSFLSGDKLPLILTAEKL